MKKYVLSACISGACLLCTCLSGQNNSVFDQAAKATELSIPASPAFIMLNDNVPSRIQRFASLHDFKVDWSMTNGQQGYTLSPGIALEAQPVWLLMFDRASASRYHKASPLARALSTFSVSVGTQSSNDKNWLAWGAKMNLYRHKDPLNDPDFLNALEAATQGAKDSLLLRIKDLEKEQIRLDRKNSAYDKNFNMLEDSILKVQFEINEVERKQSQRIAEVRDAYVQEHWNMPYLDVAFGRLMTYAQVSNPITQIISDPVTGIDTTISLDQSSLKLNAEGYAVWLSGGIGLGKNVLLSGMVQYGKRPSQLTADIAENMSGGFNLRYGTRRYNFFLEGFLDHSKIQLASFNGAELERRTYVLTLGGDWRISRNVMLTFGIRQTRDFINSTYFIQPLMNVNCLMR